MDTTLMTRILTRAESSIAMLEHEIEALRRFSKALRELDASGSVMASLIDDSIRCLCAVEDRQLETKGVLMAELEAAKRLTAGQEPPKPGQD